MGSLHYFGLQKHETLSINTSPEFEYILISSTVKNLQVFLSPERQNIVFLIKLQMIKLLLQFVQSQV